jgi:GDPmannose 4,6-dehydratase
MHLMMQQAEPSDYVIGTGSTHSVQDLVELAFGALDLDWRAHVVVDPALSRPAEVDLLCADSAKARDQLGWKPEVAFSDLIAMMVESDLRMLAAGVNTDDWASYARLPFQHAGSAGPATVQRAYATYPGYPVPNADEK